MAIDLKKVFDATVDGLTWLAVVCLLAVPAFCAGGCSVFDGGIEALPSYASLGRTVLQGELAMDLQTLTDEELLERQRIMNVVDPIVGDIKGLSEDYVAAIADEVQRRGL
jgi:hypothetical protein